MNKIFTLSLIMGLISLTSYSQNMTTDAITWNSNSAVNQADHSVLNYNCSFTTQDNTLDWSQAQGAKVMHYTVTSREGQWTDITIDGQVILNIENGSVTGTATFKRLNSQTSVHLDLLVNGKQDLDYVFVISSTSIAN